MTARRVLVAPLDWGLGHATRCIPIIRLLLEKNCDVLLGGSGDALALLKKEFPPLQVVSLPAYDPYYATGNSMAFAMIKQLPKFLRVIKKEHQLLENIVIEKNIDIVVADNRFGCWSANVPSIFITHQINILFPLRWYLFGLVINYFNRKQIRKFTACWIPDSPDEMLSGKLATTRLNVQHIGLLSRLRGPVTQEMRYDVVFVLSGPEPQRSILEEIIIREMKNSDLSGMLVRGISGSSMKQLSSRFQVIDFLSSDALQQAIQHAKLVVCRSGYSIIMDLAKLKKKAFFIPTPGQTEQEYLAARLKEKRIANFVSQHEFKIDDALHASKGYTGFNDFNFDDVLLDNVITALLH